MNRKEKVLFLVVIGMLFFGSACSSRRKAAIIPLQNAQIGYVLSGMNEHRFRCETVSAKVEVQFESGGTEMDVTLMIRIQKDSLIWASISPLLGIESTRLLITCDSVFIMDKFNRTYLATGLDFLRNYFKVNLDLEIIQSLLLGNDFEQYFTDNFKLSVEANQYHLSTANRRKMRRFVRNSDDVDRVIFQDIWLNSSSFKIEEMLIHEISDNDSKMRIKYSDFKLFNDSYLPTTVKINITRPEKSEIKLDMKRININDSLSFPFTIPDNYSRIFQ